MEYGDVIEFDDLLGVSSPEASMRLEEYDLEHFLDSALHQGSSDKAENHRPATGKALFRSHKGKRGKAGTQPTTQLRAPFSQEETPESLLDSLLSSVSPGGTVKDFSLDIDSEELRRFIADFQTGEDAEPVNGSQGTPGRLPDDHYSISSSASESLDGSSVSGEGSSVSGGSSGSAKLRQNSKMMKGMRLLVANILRSKNTALASPSLGSEDERQKDLRRQKVREKTKHREEKNLGRNQTSEGHSPQDPSSLTPPDGMRCPTQKGSGAQLSHNEKNGPLASRWDALMPGENQEIAKVFKLAVEEDKTSLEQCLRSNPSLRDSRDSQGNVLLHALCRRGKLESLRWLASGLCGHHISLENNNLFTPAAMAVKYGRLDCVEWLISNTKAKSELHSQDNRWSLLHIAARFGQEPCLRWLLQYMLNTGINLDCLDRHGNSPAHLAARHGHLTCVQTLVEFNCDVTMVNGKRHTPCSLATKYKHDTCAQLLVVTETCISLSDQVTQLRRDLREYHQEKVQLKARLDDAIGCSEALVRMQQREDEAALAGPQDTRQRVEQVRQQYEALTDLLVRRIDDMHQQRERQRERAIGGAGSADDIPAEDLGEEIALCKQRASELQDSCSQLLEEAEQARLASACSSPAKEGELSRIQETLHRLQQEGELATPAQRSCLEEQPGMEPLIMMRKRLNEVSLQRSASPSVMNVPLSERQDSISLSSSYTSLSSSSSSLSIMWNSPMGSKRSTVQKQVSWEDQCYPRDAASSASGGTPEDDKRGSVNKARDLEQEDLASKVKRHLNELISGKNNQMDATKDSKSSTSYQYYVPVSDERDYATPTNPSPTECVYTARVNGCDSAPAMVHPKDSKTEGELSHDMWMKSALPDVINSGDATREQGSKQDLDEDKLQKLSGDLSHSWHGSGSNFSRKKPLLSRLRKSSSKDGAVNGVNNVKHVRHSSENSPLSVKISPSHQNHDDDILHRPVSSSRGSGMMVPGFMRKLRPTHHHTPGGGDSATPDNPQTNHQSDIDVDSFHPRLNSDSSISSTSSWSDTDHSDTGPMYKRRAGILNRTRRTGEGTRKSRDRHIKFALDEDASPSSPAPDATYRRRDLSPIYESESHRQQREQNASGLLEQGSNAPPVEYNPVLLGHREYRVNYYSSDDDGDYETESPPPEDSPPPPGSDLQSAKSYSADSLEHSLLNGDEEADRFWYESSEEDDNNESSENKSLGSSIGSTSERHICYL